MFKLYPLCIMNDAKYKWILVTQLVSILRPVNVQFAMPMPFPPPGPMMAIPPPMMAMPPPPMQLMSYVFRPNGDGNEASTTTTTESSIAVAFPLPMPFAVPAMPPPQFCRNRPRSPSCPICPPCVCFPSCTPSFFSYCSVCHQKCRCRNTDDASSPPQPIPEPPYPGPAGGPSIFIVPYPPAKTHQKKYSSESSSSSEDSESENCNGRKHCRRSRRRMRNGRRFRGSDFEEGDNELKPVLSYVSRNGEVMLRRRLSNFDAAELLDDTDNFQPSSRDQVVQVVADPRKDNNLVVMSDDGGAGDYRRRQVVLKQEDTQLVSEGKKQLVFRPPNNKRISNLSVTFQVV